MTSPWSWTTKTDLVDDHQASHVNALQAATDVLAKMPAGHMINGRINVSVSSNNITVAIKTVDGTDPSSSDPVFIRIGNTVRKLTTSLSVTKNAGTNWFNSGSANLAANEIDYFVYLIWNTNPATDILDLGFARISHATVYGDFSGTSTNQYYLAHANGTDPVSTDDVVLVARFAASLSASASFNWSVPTFTTTNLIQHPIFKTRRLNWAPAPTGYSSVPTNTVYQYMVDHELVYVFIREATNGTSNATSVTMTLPFTAITLSNASWQGIASGIDNGAALTTPVRMEVNSSSALLACYPNMSASSTWTNSAGKRIGQGNIIYAIG